jgi:hypothetical protein
MVETITPAVHGGRRAGYWLSVGAHLLGATAAASTVGLLAGGVGALLGAPWGAAGSAAVAAAGVLYALHALVGLPVPRPQRPRQVPDWWRTFYSPVTSSCLYGVGLGIGFLTFLSFGTFAVVALVAVAGGDPVAGAVVCGPFGAARGLSVLLGCGCTEAERSAAVADRIQAVGLGRAPGAVNGAVMVALAALAVAAL